MTSLSVNNVCLVFSIEGLSYGPQLMTVTMNPSSKPEETSEPQHWREMSTSALFDMLRTLLWGADIETEPWMLLGGAHFSVW